MDKKELEHQIKNYTLIKECAEERLAELLPQLAEAEKLKPEHGDFGIEDLEDGGFPTVIIRETQFGDPSILRSIRETHSCNSSNRTHPRYSHSYAIYGNIFKLMEEWGKDLEEFDVGGRHFKIYPGDPDSFLQIEEIWHKLGRLIFAYKRKQGRE